MPNLNEGTLFYMPTTLPGISVTKAAELLQTQNKIIKIFPEVASVLGKAGRAATATDPAPTEMFETVINLKPETEWRAGMTIDKLDRRNGRALQFPGVSNAWTMPIKARIDMLSTGIRTPVGVKVFGTDLAEMEKLARQIEAASAKCPAPPAPMPSARSAATTSMSIRTARSLRATGSCVGDVQDVIAMALGAEPVTTTVEGRERYNVSIRYPRDYRSDPEAIATQVLIPTPDGGTVPLGQVAKVSARPGPVSIRTENAQLALYIFVDLRDRDIGGYVAEAQKAVASQVQFPPGYYVTWSGQFEYLQRAKAAAQDRGAGDPPDHLPAALPQLPPRDGDAHRHAVGAVRPGRRLLADVVAWLQLVGRRGRRLHRARRRRRRNRRRDADLSRQRAQGSSGAVRGRRARSSPARTCTPRSWRERSSACVQR